MKNFHLIVTLFFSVAGTIGCQPLKNRASFIKLECGLGSEAYESDTRVVQFLNANGAPLARDLAVTIDSLPSSVSEHGCIVLPSKGPLELRAISPSTQTGIRLQTSIDAMYSKIQLARLPDAIVGEFTCPKTLAVRNKEELFVPFSLLDSGGHGLVSYNQITEIQYNLKTNGSESLPIAAIDPLKDPNPLRLIASRLTTMNIPDGQYQAELRIKSLRGIEFRTLSPCFINFKSTAPANDLKIFSAKP